MQTVKTIDAQINELEQDVIFCTRCVTSKKVNGN